MICSELMRLRVLSKVGVIDYDAGNTKSVIKALEFLGCDVMLSSNKTELKNCDKIILPGVGAYFDAMQKLKDRELTDTIKELIKSGRNFLGICLGMQLLFEYSEENIGTDTDSVQGLGILPGRIKKFNELPAEMKIPHMGWNSLQIQEQPAKLLANIGEKPYVYFVHSYYLQASDRNTVAATTEYGLTFDSSVAKDNIFGCQFHPEKSGTVGLKILENFCNMKE